MFRRLSLFTLVFFVMAIFACQSIYFYPLLPDRLASHFGLGGRPDGLMSKSGFVTSYGLFLFFLTLFVSGASLLFRVVPTELINLPNKEYWFGAERRERTIARLESAMSSIALATSALMILLVQQIYEANLSPDPKLGVSPWIDLGFYLVFLVAWTINLIRRFQITRS